MAAKFDTQYTDVSGGSELRLSDYLVTLLENWRMITAVTLLALAVGTCFAFLQSPVYRADAMIQVEDSKGNQNQNQNNSLQTLSSIFDSKSSAAAETELIRSRLVVEEAVRKLHLDIAAGPRYFPVIGRWLASLNGSLAAPTTLLGLSDYAWGPESITMSSFETPQKSYGKPFVLVVEGDRSYSLRDPDGNPVLQGRVGEETTGTTPLGPVSVRIDQLVGRKGSQFVLVRSSTVGTVERIQRALSVGELTLQSGIIRASLEGPDSKLTADIINTIARQFVQQDIGRRSAEAEHTLAFLDQQLPALRKQLDQAEERYNAFRNRQGTVNLGEESRLLLQQIVDNKASLDKLQTRLSEVRTLYTDQNPAVQALTAQIATLTSQQGALRRKVSVLPDTEQAALRLERDVRVNTELYTNLLNNAQQLRVVKAGQVGNVRVVDFAEPADDPVRPQRVVLILISGGVGLVLGALLAFLRKGLYGGVEHPQELERMLGVPVCAVIPRSRTQLRLQREIHSGRNRQGVLAARAPDDIAVEGVRSLRTALRGALATASNNVVMLTGSSQDAGKSFMSVNLAALVASGRKRVLLIDGDMRRGEVHAHFGLAQVPGLSDALMGTDIDSVVVHDVLPGLDVLPRGTLPADPAELLMSERLDSLLDHFKQRYDMVVIDTPPVLAVTDAALLGRHAGTTLLVVRHGRHSANEVAETARRLNNGSVTLQGVLLTDVPKPPLQLRTGYTDYYGYQGSAK
ncbi:polysaccharide biosynthesis tyrosine autokinase [Cupriavidus sp. 2TAF22]|uniref:polysaccharide biosynthesis tyrosine autokinase n=1 Tax=unclassified Cupriavidus TaxID=2640874 RepID=UPI003F8DAA9F